MILSRIYIIDSNVKTSILFLSVLFAATGDFILSTIISEKYRIFKYILYFHGTIAIIGSVVYFMVLLL